MAATNNITGDSLVTKVGSKEAQENYESNYDRIFGKKKKVEYSEDWQPEERATAISQNGNDGTHYDKI